MRVLVITPAEQVVSLEMAKEHLRVMHSREDALISAYIAAAQAHIDGPDGWLGRAIGAQTLEMHLPAFGACGWIALPYPPSVEIEAIEYIDAAGSTVTLDQSQYQLSGNLVRPVWPASFPSAAWRGPGAETVIVRWTAGYDEAPQPIRVAILLMVGDLYANRETTALGLSASAIPMSTTVENLLAPYRIYR